METLKEHIEKHGFDYHLYKRVGNVAAYHQYDDGKYIGTEVFIVKSCKESTLPDGYVVYPKELFPGNDDFGNTAFSFRSFDGNISNKVEEKFNQLIARETNKQKPL